MSILLYVIVMAIYFCYMRRYIESMKRFHSFMNNYRLTPKSRFIRKYKPSLEPLYEEQSAFEMSHRSSQTTEMGKHTHSSAFGASVFNQRYMVGGSQTIDTMSG